MSKRLLSLVLRIGLCAGLSVALAAPASTLAGNAELLTIAPEIVAARIQSRFMIP